MAKSRKKRSYQSKRRKKKKSSNDFKKSALNVLKLVFVLALIGLIVYYFFIRQPKSEMPSTLNTSRRASVEVSNFDAPIEFKKMISSVFNDFGLLPEWVKERGSTINIRLPEEVITVVMINRLIDDARRIGWDVKTSFEDASRNRTVLELQDRRDEVRRLVFTQEANLHINQGKIAIIIDDFGYANDDMVKRILTYPKKITVSILPGMPKTDAIYKEAQQYNKETLVHVPMEAMNEEVDYTEYTIYATMNEDEVRSRIRKAFNDFPSSQGMNNHMGSKVTSNEDIMSIIVDELKKNNKFLVDSRTTDKSVAYKIAQSNGLPSAMNNLFLEQSRNDTEDYLVKKLEALAKIANTRGYSIGIGHPYDTTIKVLLEQIPEFERKGYEFVFVSEVLTK